MAGGEEDGPLLAAEQRLAPGRGEEEQGEPGSERRRTLASGAESSTGCIAEGDTRGATRAGSGVEGGDAVMASGLSTDMNAEAESASREGEQRRGQNSGQVGRQRAPERSSGEAIDVEDEARTRHIEEEARSDSIKVPGDGRPANDGRARAKRSTCARHNAGVHSEQGDAKRLDVKADPQRAKRASTEASVASVASRKMIRNAVCARVHQCGRSNEVLYRICILAHVVVVVGLHDPECVIFQG